MWNMDKRSYQDKDIFTKVGKITTDAIENSVLARIPIFLFENTLKIISFVLYGIAIVSSA